MYKRKQDSSQSNTNHIFWSHSAGSEFSDWQQQLIQSLSLHFIRFFPSRKLKPPLVPKLKYEGDTSNFDDYPEDDLNKVPVVSEREQRVFDDFWEGEGDGAKETFLTCETSLRRPPREIIYLCYWSQQLKNLQCNIRVRNKPCIWC